MHQSNIMYCFNDKHEITKIAFKFINKQKKRYLKKNAQLLEEK